jgi:hypothetical protein
VWIDLSYDYYKWAVIGEVNDGQGDLPEGQALVGKAIRVA